MAFEKTPSGTRGPRRSSRANPLIRFAGRMAVRMHRRGGDRFQGMDLLYLTTVGAKSGEKRVTPVARFPDDGGAWLVVASAAGSANHPAWYHNIAAHPDQVWIEVGGHHFRVQPEQLDGERREQAWQRITAAQPRFAGYERKTDRVMPVVRLAPVEEVGHP
jgi:deazaflavin-dependent oxidoreductase (nitroreductase family)